LHVLATVLYLIYLSTVIYSSLESDSSNRECDLLWKICSTLYIGVTMSVYLFYYAKSRVVNSVLWRGKKWSERFVLIMIMMMAVFGLCFFWPPIKNVQYNGMLVNGECRLVKRRWIAILWVCGDSVLSIVLLALFVRPLKYLKSQIGSAQRLDGTLTGMERMTEKNRNLLFCTVTVTIGLYTTLAVIGDLPMRTAIYMAAIDRLVTLQCITMSFSYDMREIIYFFPFLKKRNPIILEEKSCSEEVHPRISASTSLIVISSTSNFFRKEDKSLSYANLSGGDCMEIAH
jgi:hypothetical protein